MDIKYRKDHEWTSTQCDHIRILDNEGNEYRITCNKFGGIEILSEDGSVAIEPIVSNHFVIKRTK